MKLSVLYYQAPEDSDIGIIGITDSPTLLFNEVYDLLYRFEKETFMELSENQRNNLVEAITRGEITSYNRFDFFKEKVNVIMFKELINLKAKLKTTAHYELGGNLDIIIKEIEKEGAEVEIIPTDDAKGYSKELYPDIIEYGFDSVFLPKDMIRTAGGESNE
jgi:hypothetical protein